jgi:hypothetical protein
MRPLVRPTHLEPTARTPLRLLSGRFEDAKARVAALLKKNPKDVVC